MGYFLSAVALVVAGFMGFLIYDDYSAEKFSLRKDEWFCSARHTEITTVVYPDGKSGVLVVPSFVTVCDRYDRKIH